MNEFADSDGFGARIGASIDRFVQSRASAFRPPVSARGVPSVAEPIRWAAARFVTVSLLTVIVLQGQETSARGTINTSAGVESPSLAPFALPSFHPTESVVLSPKSEMARFPGLVSNTGGPRPTAIFAVRDLRIPSGVRLSIEGYDAVVFNISDEAVIDGDIVFPGGKLFVVGHRFRADVRGGIDVSGQTGGNGIPGGQGSPTVGGVGGQGGTPGNGGAYGFTGWGGGGNPGGSVGGPIGQPVSPAQPAWTVPRDQNNNWYYYDCNTAAGGSAGGSNGTMGAQVPGRAAGGYYYAVGPLGTPVVGSSLSPAGGGSGGGGGCGTRHSWDNGQNWVWMSGGGGGGGGGGAGGAVVIQTGTGPLTISLFNSVGIKANGGNGGNGGSGEIPTVTFNATTDGAGGGGGGAGGAGGYIVLQGSTITLTNGVSSLSANGGSGGVGGSGSVGSGSTGLDGWYGAGGGGGRMALYSSWGVFDGSGRQINPANDGIPGSGRSGGQPTVFVATVTMTPTPTNFIPRNSATIAAMPCDGGGCYQNYTASISASSTAGINPASVSGVFTFSLSSSALRGYATNYCNANDCSDPVYDLGPDYVFEGFKNSGFNVPTNGGESIQTSSAVNSATVTVSSRDYGGSAKITGSVNINGIVVTAGVTQPTSGATLQELFARLPVDVCGPAGCRPTGDTNPLENCMTDPYSNCIADQWELNVTTQAGLPPSYLDRNLDNEVGPPGSTSPGDGYSAHDEYRGFIYWDGVEVNHVRTDPVKTKDVFFWDLAGVSNALSAVLGPATSPGMSFYRILDQSARLDPSRSLTPDLKTVFQHNWNTIGPTKGFPVVYIDGGGSVPCGSGSFVLGLTVTRLNNGVDAITIYNGRRIDMATRFGYDTLLLAGNGVAHETGHKFTIEHPIRTPTPTFVDITTLPALSSLGRDQYTIDTTAQIIYVWKSYYKRADVCGGEARFMLDNIAANNGLTVSNGPADLTTPPPPGDVVPGTDDGVSAIFATHYVNALGRLAGGSLAPLNIEKTEDLIMDWAPDLRIVAWFFNGRDLLGMRVRP